MHTKEIDHECPRCGERIEVYIPHECKYREKTREELAWDAAEQERKDAADSNP